MTRPPTDQPQCDAVPRGGGMCRGWRAAAIIAAAAVLPYLNSLWGSFHFDDQWDIVLNPHLGSLRDVMAYPLLARWLTAFTYFLNYQVHGFEFLPGWHAVNILLHAACALMLFAALRLLLADGAAARQRRHAIRMADGSPSPPSPLPRRGEGSAARPAAKPWHPASALVAALIFAVHPLATEPVNYIRARSVILCAIFTLAALVGAAMLARGGSRRRKVLAVALMAISVTLAAISKEVGGIYAAAAVMLFGVLFVLVPRITARRAAVAAAVLVAVAAVGGAWMWMSGTAGLAEERVFNPLSGSHFWAMTTVFWQYAGLAVLPLPSRLTCDHYVPYYPTRVYAAGDADVIVAVLGLVLLVAVAVAVARRRPAVSLLMLLALAAMAPYFFITTVDIFVEYKFYLSLACLSGLAGMGAGWLITRQRAAAWALIAVVCVALACGTFVRNQVWRTDLTLWEDAAAKAPRKARTINALAWALATDKTAPDPPRALELALKSFDPKRVDPWWGYDANMLDTLAEAYYANGMYEKAVETEQAVIREGQGDTGFFMRQLQKFQGALDRRKHAEAAGPSHP